MVKKKETASCPLEPLDPDLDKSSQPLDPLPS